MTVFHFKGGRVSGACQAHAGRVTGAWQALININIVYINMNRSALSFDATANQPIQIASRVRRSERVVYSFHKTPLREDQCSTHIHQLAEQVDLVFDRNVIVRFRGRAHRSTDEGIPPTT